MCCLTRRQIEADHTDFLPKRPKAIQNGRRHPISSPFRPSSGQATKLACGCAEAAALPPAHDCLRIGEVITNRFKIALVVERLMRTALEEDLTSLGIEDDSAGVEDDDPFAGNVDVEHRPQEDVGYADQVVHDHPVVVVDHGLVTVREGAEKGHPLDDSNRIACAVVEGRYAVIDLERSVDSEATQLGV